MVCTSRFLDFASRRRHTRHVRQRLLFLLHVDHDKSVHVDITVQINVHRSSHHSTQRTGETPAGCEHSTSVTSLNSTSSHGNGRWLFIKSYRLQNMRTHTNTATNANEQMSTSTPFHSRQFSSSRVNPCHALPQPCDKLEEWVLGNHFSALN